MPRSWGARLLGSRFMLTRHSTACADVINSIASTACTLLITVRSFRAACVDIDT